MKRPKLEDFRTKYSSADTSSNLQQYSKAQDAYIDYLETPIEPICFCEVKGSRKCLNCFIEDYKPEYHKELDISKK